MPVRAPSICSHCGSAHPAGERCQRARDVERERKARFDLKRPNASKRGYDKEWEKVSRSFLAEPGNDLCDCGAPATLVRHVKSIRTRPDLRMVRSNWRPGCQRCNARDAAEERRMLERNKQ